MKTNNDNKQLYRDMQEAPDKYSDQEIESMMDDLDQVPDVDKAWQQFESEELRVKSEEFATALPTMRFHSLLRKMAASFVGLLLVSGVAFAAIHIVRQYQKPEAPLAADTMAEANSSLFTLNSSLPADTIVKTEPVVFDNVTLDSIVKVIAAFHHLDMDLQNERQRVGASAGMQASQLRFYFVWNQEESLQEVIEKLNMFEQVNLAVEDGKLMVR
ncbi:MAG: DUF4974 domain-containing protein [Prevotella sp.]|nr:DUF4974 domain-containing protein [Prevotella sp.]